jgi:competence protein ComGC
MNEDISNKTIFILVILTVVISMFSTFLLLSMDNTQADLSSESDTGDAAKISFEIKEPAEPDSVTGKITFKIEDNI